MTESVPARLRIVIALKLIGVPLLLAIVVWGMARADLAQAAFDPVSLLAALALNQIALLLVALRLERLVKAAGGRLGIWQSQHLTLRSLFYYIALPSGVAMDVHRFFAVRDALPRLRNRMAAAVVLLDRGIGAACAAMIALLAVAWLVPAELTVQSMVAPAVLAAVLLCLAGVGVSMLVRRVPRRTGVMIRMLARRWREIAAATALGMLAQSAVIASIYMTCVGVGGVITVAQTAFGIAGGTVFMVLPVSFAGLGPAEAGGAGLLATVGVATQTAVVAVGAAYAGRVIAAIEGAALEMIDGTSQLYRLARPPGRASSP